MAALDVDVVIAVAVGFRDRLVAGPAMRTLFFYHPWLA
jgi:hypothetical protein